MITLTNVLEKITFCNEGKVAVAVSGGGDSMALLSLLHTWIQQYSFSLVVLTVDHNLREDSFEDTLFVQNFARKNHIECVVLQYKGEKPQSNIQEAARKIRYQLLSNYCYKNAIKTIFTAHHSNDQAETVLMRLARGSGIDGICAIPQVSYLDVGQYDCQYSTHKLRIIRPLLSYTHRQLLVYLKSQNITWKEDVSNSNKLFTRSIYREFLTLTARPNVLVKRLNQTAQHAQLAKEALEYYTQKALQNCVNINNSGFIELDCCALYQLPLEITRRVLLYCLDARYHKPRYKSFQRLFTKILNKNFFTTTTLNGYKIIPYNMHKIIFVRELAAVTNDVLLSSQNDIIWDNRFIITKAEKNYYLGALGITGYNSIAKLVSKYKVLYDAAITAPVIRSIDHKVILACPLLKYYNNFMQKEQLCIQFIGNRSFLSICNEKNL